MSFFPCKRSLRLSLLCALLSLTGCASQQQSVLYEQLGGEPGLAALVDNLLQKMADDEEIARHFQDTDIALFRKGLIDKLCVVSDGPCEYTGDTMKNIHKGFNISQADFDSLVQHLIHAMQEEGVPIAGRNALLKRLAPMYQEVVYQ
ncbi:group I truncated hemoglobin [Porticoccus sp.]